MPSFGSPWAYCLAFDEPAAPPGAAPVAPATDETMTRKQRWATKWCEQSAAEIDARLSQRVSPGALRCYDGAAHRGMFGLPKYVRAAMAAENRVITIESPVFMY